MRFSRKTLLYGLGIVTALAFDSAGFAQDGPAPSIDAVEVKKLNAQFRKSRDLAIAAPGHPPLDEIPPIPMPIEDEALQPQVDDGGGNPVLHDTESGITIDLPVKLAKQVGLPHGGGYAGSDGGGDSLDIRANGFNGDMTVVGDTAAAPWRMNVKLVMRFVDANGVDRFGVCSGSMRDASTVLTAGHCVFNRSNGWGWARQVWVYPGWDGVGTQFGAPTTIINPYGMGVSTQLGSWTSWTDNGDFNYDVGIICINRAVGFLTGWFGWAYGGSCSWHTSQTYHNASYPAETCSSTLHTGRDMYYWFGNFDRCVGSNRLEIDTTGGCLNAGWGGMSGGGAYYIADGSRYVHCVASTSDRSTYIRYARQWEAWVDWCNDTFIDDYCRGDQFDLQALDMNCEPIVLVAGGSTTLLNHLAVNGTNGSQNGTFRFTVYLSSNDNISSADTALSTQQYTRNFGAMSSVRVNMAQVTIPADTPPGDYFIGVEYEATTDGTASNNSTDNWDAVAVTIEDCPTETIVRMSTWFDDMKALANSIGLLTQLRKFRDEVMARSEIGRDYIDLYYAHSDEIVRLFVKDRSLARESADVLMRIAPKVQRAIQNKPTLLDAADIAAAEHLMDRMTAVASPELKASIAAVKSDLKGGKLADMFSSVRDLPIVENSKSSSSAMHLGYVGLIVVAGAVYFVRRKRQLAV